MTTAFIRLSSLFIFIACVFFEGQSQTKLLITRHGECLVPAVWECINDEYFSRNDTTMSRYRTVHMVGEEYSISHPENFDIAVIGALWLPQNNSTKCSIDDVKENIEAMLPKPMRKSEPKWSYDKTTDTWICECLISSMGGKHGVLYHFDEKRTCYLRYRDGIAYFLEITATAFNKSIEQNQKIYDAIYRSWKPGAK